MSSDPQSPQLFPERTNRFDEELFGDELNSNAAIGGVAAGITPALLSPFVHVDTKEEIKPHPMFPPVSRSWDGATAPPTSSQTDWWESRILAVESRMDAIDAAIVAAKAPGPDWKSTRFWINVLMQIGGGYLISKGREELGVALMVASGMSYTHIMTSGKVKMAGGLMGALSSAVSAIGQPAQQSPKSPEK